MFKDVQLDRLDRPSVAACIRVISIMHAARGARRSEIKLLIYIMENLLTCMAIVTFQPADVLCPCCDVPTAQKSPHLVSPSGSTPDPRTMSDKDPVHFRR